MLKSIYNSTQTMVYILLAASIWGAVSMQSWISIWMMMEFNMLVFLPIMMQKTTFKTSSTNSFCIYFLTQSISSMMFLLSPLASNITKMSSQASEFLPEKMLLFSLLIKSGTFPYHFWVPKVMKGMSWMNCLILMTIQKVVPVFLLTEVFSNSTKTLMLVAMMSGAVGVIGAINQSDLRMVMAYSSINHMGWVIISMGDASTTWKYLLFYFMITSQLVVSMELLGWNYLHQMLYSKTTSPYINMINLINIFSIGGIPPFLGFIPKLMVSISIIQLKSPLILSIMFLMNLIMAFVYMRMILSSIMLASNKMKFSINSKLNQSGSMTFSTIFTITFMVNFYMIYLI